MTSNVDHLVYAVPDLQEGMDLVESQLGVRPAIGGRHPHLGSHNALLSLGEDVYLEVVAPDPDLPRPPRGVVFNMDGISKAHLTTWAMRAEDIQGMAKRSTSGGFDVGALAQGSRQRPDGSMLHWQLSDPYVMAFGGLVPFLIAWGDSPHPAQSAPPAGRLLALEAEHPEPDTVTAALDALGADLTVTPGPAPLLRARIEGEDGRVRLLE
ncbi:MAG: VOC family protein [Gemmatimonadetes bacterium]|nr:VOC family protein [Gemmatimonadota bacterium]